MGLAVAAEPKAKKSKAEVSAEAASPAPSAFALEGIYGAPAGMPAFLALGLQRKLAVGAVDDPLEREADQVADRVMRSVDRSDSTTPRFLRAGTGYQGIQRKCACGGSSSGECEECQKKREEELPGTPPIRRRASGNGNGNGNGAGGEAPPIVHEVLRSPGKPLDDSIRPLMEGHFGRDFGDVRVHTDPIAAKSATAVNALAYTAGEDVVFASGQYTPHSTAGKRLLAHELTHVVQQRRGPGSFDAARMDGEEGQHHSISIADDSVQRQPLPLSSPAPAAGVTPPPPPVPSAGGSAATPAAPPAGPFDWRKAMSSEIRQGPIGDVVIPIGDWTFFDGKSTTKEWKKDFGKTTFLTVPIPDLLASVDIVGSGGAHATFTASFGPCVLRNIKVGVSTSDYYLSVWPDDKVILPLLGTAGKLWVLRQDLDEFRALGDLDVPAHIGVDLGINGSIEAAATALELFKVASIALGFRASASAGADLSFGGPIGLYYQGGHLTFRFNAALEAQLNLALNLIAFVEATLLGFNWTDTWVLFNKDLGKTWRIGAPLDAGYDNEPTVSMATDEDDLDIVPLLKDLFGAVKGMQAKQEVQGPSPGVPEMPVRQAHDQSIGASRHPELLKGHGAFAPGRAGRGFTPAENDSVDDIGYATGDHSYPGVMVPGTKTIDLRTKAGKRGQPNWIPDHQPPDTLLEGGASLSFHFYPHSLSSAQMQGGTVLAYKKSMKKLRNRGDTNWSEGVQSDWFW